jgi:hypothetical protein
MGNIPVVMTMNYPVDGTITNPLKNLYKEMGGRAQVKPVVLQENKSRAVFRKIYGGE